MIKKKQAFTLLEMIFVVIVIAILAAVIIPRVGRDTFYKEYLVRTTTRKMVADLRLARRLSISHGSTNSSGYSFNLIGSSPYTGWRIVDEATSNTYGEDQSFDSDITCTGSQNPITFNGIGGATYTGGAITLTNSGSPTAVTYQIAVTKSTGRIAMVEQ